MCSGSTVRVCSGEAWVATVRAELCETLRSFAYTHAPCFHRINYHVAEMSVVDSQLPREYLSSICPPLVVQRVNVWVQGVYKTERCSFTHVVVNSGLVGACACFKLAAHVRGLTRLLRAAGPCPPPAR